jgi:hypothetical protein
MTGAATVVWFLGKGKPREPDRTHDEVELLKPDSRLEAQRAVQESAARNEKATQQRGAVSRLAHSLAEIRENNHFADKIRIAMGGDE